MQINDKENSPFLSINVASYNLNTQSSVLVVQDQYVFITILQKKIIIINLKEGGVL